MNNRTRGIRYIHYGSNEFNPDEMYNTIKTINNKPNFGLWASRTNAKYEWKDFCEDNDFKIEKLDKSFTFMLSPEAKILNVYNKEFGELEKYIVDVDTYMNNIKSDPDAKRIDFASIIKDGYDAIEYYYSSGSLSLTNPVYDLLYGWDCDSIVVFNSDVIIPMKEVNNEKDN